MDHGEMSTKETTNVKLIPGYENVMELVQRREEMKTKISSPQDDEFDIIMEVGKKEDVKMKVFIGEKESEDIHLEELIEFSRKLEALHPKVKTSEVPPLDLSFKDSVAGFDSLDLFWRTPSFEQLRVELSEEPLDLYLKDSFNSIGSLRHVYVATEPEWVVSEPFVPVSCATVSFNEMEVKKRDDQKHKGEKAKKKTPNDGILSISSSRRAEEKKSDDEDGKEGDDKRELPLVPSVNLESSVLEEEVQKNMATKRTSEETKTCSTSNKKNKNEVVKTVLNQPIGGIVGLSEFPQVIEEHCSPPNVPPLPNLNLKTHPQPHLGGRVRKEQP
ncbi:unnamed protein product [Arabidopsis arenosa]|uniref:Uncharacterized protein n=1 Tax=Arabidopsis arenosa TaxID=38785 RepID=A0A8S2B757_ARAAE|nr:unnamed protein product [Arabidopsis arenosa]